MTHTTVGLTPFSLGTRYLIATDSIRYLNWSREGQTDRISIDGDG